MNTNTIIANIICVIPYTIMIVYTFLNTKRKTILICNIVATLLSGIQFLILEAYSGAFASFFSTLMYVVFYFKGRNKFLSSWAVPIIYGIIYIIVGIISYENWLSLFPTICCLISVYSMWMDKEFIIKVSNIPISILWIIYNILFTQIVGTIGQSVLLIIDIVYIFLYFKKYKYINI